MKNDATKCDMAQFYYFQLHQIAQPSNSKKSVNGV